MRQSTTILTRICAPHPFCAAFGAACAATVPPACGGGLPGPARPAARHPQRRRFSRRLRLALTFAAKVCPKTPPPSKPCATAFSTATASPRRAGRRPRYPPRRPPRLRRRRHRSGRGQGRPRRAGVPDRAQATAASRITANAAPGLFYGVETLVQLASRRDGALWLPAGRDHRLARPATARALLGRRPPPGAAGGAEAGHPPGGVLQDQRLRPQARRPLPVPPRPGRWSSRRRCRRGSCRS